MSVRLVALTLLGLVGGLVATRSASANPVAVPNASFETGGGNTFELPTGWVADQADLPGDPAGDGNAGVVTEPTNGVSTPDGSRFARIGIQGDGDSNTSFTRTISSGVLGTYAADTTYTLTFYATRAEYADGNERFALGGLRADGISVAAAPEFDLGTQAPNWTDYTGVWVQLTATLDTAVNTAVVGDDISVYLGFRQNGNNFKSLFFDNVAVTATSNVPEPASLALVALGGVLALGRRRA